MPRRKRNPNSAKGKIEEFIEHISDFSDIEYNDDYTTDYINNIKKREESCDDESDDSWMYEYQPSSDVDIGCSPMDEELEEEELYHIIDETDSACEDKKNMQKKTKKTDCGNSFINNELNTYMSAAVWFNDMSSRGIKKEEKRYVELMIIELANFYFAHLENMNPSKKCMDAIRLIDKYIREGGVCTG